MLRQRSDQALQHITNSRRGMIAGQVSEQHVSGRALDESDDRGLVLLPDDQIALPMPRNSTIFDLRRPVADHNHRVDEPARAMLRGLLRNAARTPGAQRLGHLAFEPATGLEVESLVDRLRAHPHALIVWMLLADPITDLLRRPFSPQAIGDILP